MIEFGSKIKNLFASFYFTIFYKNNGKLFL